MNSFLPFLAAALTAMPGQLRAQRTLDPPFLNSLRAEAARSHPEATAARLRAAAASRDISAIRLWDDPMVGLSVMAAEVDMRRNEGDIRLSLEQPLPKPGLYQAERDQAAALHRAELADSRQAALEAGAAAARDAIELALADESIALQSEQVRWLRGMAENARELALNPGTASTDALRLGTELAREEQILAAARRTRDNLAARLNLLLGRPAGQPWTPLRLPENPLPVPVAAAEIARIPKASPRFRAAREQAAAAGAEVRITGREELPQFAVGVETALYSGGDLRSVGVGVRMSLPQFNRRATQAKIAGARLREQAAVSGIEAVRREIAADVLNAATAAANAAAQARAFGGEIATQATAATDSVQAAWLSSQATVTDLLDSNRSLFSIRLEQRRFIAMELAALEELRLLVPYP